MTSFTPCPETSFTLRRVRSTRGGGEGNGLKPMDVREQRVRFVVEAAQRAQPLGARELDPENQRSTIVERWFPKSLPNKEL
jgi:hypothetical protein